VTYRRNVRASWLVMAEVVSSVAVECFIAHLEPNPGVGYDCLSLVTRDSSGGTTVQFMLNRNGQSASVRGEVISGIWDLVERNGPAAVARQLVTASGMKPEGQPHQSEVSAVANRVVQWIEAHRESAFSVGLPDRVGSRSRLLHSIGEQVPSELWPIDDHGPELSLGVDGIEQERLTFVSAVPRLALEIARCPEIRVAIGDRQHPCNAVVACQTPVDGAWRQVPEAWVGNLTEARIIVISSNPSISTPSEPGTGEDYPLAGYHDVASPHPDWPARGRRLLEFQTERLSQHGERPLVNDRAQFRCVDGLYRGNDNPRSLTAPQPYWSAAFKQARRLLGAGFDLGRDLCLTEIVHCKSKGEEGVAAAAPRCASRYLVRLLEASSAPLVVIGG
jgi:hypothetical protein